jgi:PKD repeat protein
LRTINAGKTNSLTRSNYIVAGLAPTAAFTATPTNGFSPLTVTFANTSANAASYVWNFGDGTTDTNVNPVHIYSATNTRPFTVTLQAIGSGLTNTATGVNFIHVAVP